MTDEVTPELDDVFYYAHCSERGLAFAVWSKLKKDAVTDDDITKISCPSCSWQFPLVI